MNKIILEELMLVMRDVDIIYYWWYIYMYMELMVFGIVL